MTKLLLLFLLSVAPAVLGYYTSSSSWNKPADQGGSYGGSGSSYGGSGSSYGGSGSSYGGSGSSYGGSGSSYGGSGSSYGGSGSSYGGSGSSYGGSGSSYGGSGSAYGGSYGGSGASFGGSGSSSFGSSSGVQGIISNIVNTAKDVISNSFDTSKLTLNSLKDLLDNTNYMLTHNPMTQPVGGYEESGLGSSLRMLNQIYMENLDAVSEVIFSRMGRIDKIKEKLETVEGGMKRAINDLSRTSSRCLTTMLATEITNEMCRCSLLPVKEVVTEVVATQEEVRAITTELNVHLNQREICIKMPITQAVMCIQSLVSSTANLLHGMAGQFSVPTSLQANMVPISECVRSTREQIKSACGTNFY